MCAALSEGRIEAQISAVMGHKPIHFSAPINLVSSVLHRLMINLNVFLIDRQTDRQTNRQTDRQTDRQIDRQASRQAGGRAGRQADVQTDGQTDGRTDGRTDR